MSGTLYLIKKYKKISTNATERNTLIIIFQYYCTVVTGFWTTGKWTHIRLLDSNRLAPI